MKAHYRKAAATQKLLLSFVQVLVGVQFYLKVEWPEKFTNMLNKFSLNMFQAISATNSCNAVESYYYLELILWFCAPIAITLLLTVIGLGIYFVFLTSMGEGSTNRSQNILNVWNLYCKLCLWICLVFFPQLSYV